MSDKKTNKHNDEVIKEIVRKALSGKAIGRDNALLLGEILQDDAMRAIYNAECVVVEAERAEKSSKHLLMKFDARYGAYVSFENFPFRKKINLGESKVNAIATLAKAGVMDMVQESLTELSTAKDESKSYRLDVGEYFPDAK